MYQVIRGINLADFQVPEDWTRAFSIASRPGLSAEGDAFCHCSYMMRLNAQLNSVSISRLTYIRHCRLQECLPKHFMPF